MARKAMTVSALARESSLEVDDTLVTLWDAGIDFPSKPSDLIPSHKLNEARRALGLPVSADQKRVAFWMAELNMDRSELEAHLQSLGINLNPSAQRLPKGAIRKLSPKEVSRDRPPQSRSDRSRRAIREPLIWETIGRPRDVRHLTGEEVMGIHFLLVRDFKNSTDPISPPGLRDETLLESALFRPKTTNGDIRKYPTVEMSAAALLHAIIHNHPFFNGNKRTALVSMAVVLYENGLRLGCSQDDLFKVVLKTAQHALVAPGSTELADREVLELSRWIKTQSAGIQRGEKVLKWYQLRKLLSRFDVGIAHAGGNRVNLSRTIQSRTRVTRGGQKTQTLRTQVGYHSDGADVPRRDIVKLRRDLQLDETAGVDSATFYEGADIPEFFISEYQRTLRRLARL